ncbi:MAG: chloride channel protein [Gammaproteobacteria bacterium]|nr:chloride channel protein [Gammaproteobacteria bacterium]
MQFTSCYLIFFGRLRVLEKLRLHLAGADALPLLALLGLLSGLVAGGVIILLRLLVESIQHGFLPDGDIENYEALSMAVRFALPVFGGLVIGLLFQLAGKDAIVVGIVHVQERLAYHQANLPVKNFIMQFIGAVISITSGHSVGREGPGVHLGAASASLIGQWFKLPHNTLRILVACGVSASIAASFNTPFAGVIFAMEVIMWEYTIIGFTPIVLAAVSATFLSQTVFGSQSVFSVPALQLATYVELPVLLLMGVMIGALSAAFIAMLKFTIVKTNQIDVWQRLTLAGVVTGICAVFVPQIMSIGYDTVNQAMLGEIGLALLLLIVIVKLVATAVGLGLGLPGGLIGPTLVIGAAAGGIVGIVAETVLPNQVASVGFYAMIGMAAMMGATLQAPLAALMALLELTLNTNVILPGMLVVVVAGIASSHLFRQESVFVMLLKVKGLDYQHSPVAQSLRRIGVASVMTRSFVRSNQLIRRTQAQTLLQSEPDWIVVENENLPMVVMPSVDLAQFLGVNQQDVIDLIAIPGQRTDSELVDIRDTLQRVLEVMDERQINMVVVGKMDSAKNALIHGIVTRAMIETHYRYR